MTVLWVAQAVTVTNGQKEVVVTSAPGNAITKVETSAYFHGVGFSLPYEIERTYNNGTNDVIVLYENWAGSSGSIGAVAAPSGAAVTRAANSLEELKSVYEAIADSVSTTATANSIPQRDSNGRLKAAPASASDDVVVKSQTGTASAADTAATGDADTNKVMRVGYGGLGVDVQQPDWPNASLNNCDGVVSGTYRCTGSVADSPTNTGIIKFSRRNSGQLLQEIVSGYDASDSDIKQWRNSNGGADSAPNWSEWKKDLHSQNTLTDKLVAQSAGGSLGAFFIASSTTAGSLYVPLKRNERPTGFTIDGSLTIANAGLMTAVLTGLTASDFSFNGRSDRTIMRLYASSLTGLEADKLYIVRMDDGVTGGINATY